MKIFDNDRAFSHNEFGSGVLKFAKHLKEAYKISNKSYIGIIMERSIEMVASIYSVINIDCAYVPVDTNWPESRILECFENANVKFVLTDLKFKNRVENLGFTAIVPNFSFDSSNSNIDQWRISNKRLPAYVLFTSGSTGKPKGVVVPQSAVLNLVSYIQKKYPLKSGDPIMFKSPYTFDGSIWEIFAWTEANADLYVAPVGMEKDPEQLLNAIHKHRISFIFFVPAMLNSFLDYLSIADINPQESFSNLKWISVGGETLTVQLVQKFYEQINFNKAKLINVYGPTETTVYATTYLCNPNEKQKKIPIGYPVDNYQIYILKEDLELANQGEEGEIFISGEGVALGYLNREELTAERFIPDHIKGQGIMYRTGDIGVESTPGIFDFIGRKDFQVKIRGYRMEMGEIEYAINNLPYIKEAVAIAVKDSNNQGVLLCFAIIEQTSIISEDQQKNQMVQDLQRVLPEYMIPDHIFFVKEFPLSENGKVDRNRLSNQYLSINQTPTTEQNTITDFSKQNLEIILTQCWSYVLNLSIDAIEKQRESTFFELGGNSIKSIQLIVQIKKRLDIKLSIGELYQNSTLNDQVSLIIEKSKEVKKADSLSNLEPQSCSLSSKFLLTPVQRQMWAMHHLDPTHKINNIRLEIDVIGCPIIDAIEGFQKTLDFFDALKTTFSTENGEVYQIVDKKLKSPKISFNHTNDNNIVFNLEKFPLYHTIAKTIEPNHTMFILTIHHIIFDGWSLSLFMNKLNEFLNLPKYAIYNKDSHTELLSKSITLLNKQERENLEYDLSFWKRVMTNTPPLPYFPKKESYDYENTTQNGDRYWWTIEKSVSTNIDKKCSELGVTQYALFLSAYQIALSTISNEKEVVTGTPYAGREDEFLQQIIGYYTNMIAIRGNINHNKKSYDLIKEQMNNSINAFSHSSVSFGTIQKNLNKDAKIGSNTLYNNIFVLQNWPHSYNNTNSTIKIRQKEVGNNTSKADFLLNIEKKESEYACWIEYDTALYNKNLTIKLANAINLCIDLLIEKNDYLINIKSKILNTYKKGFDFSCAIIGNGSLVESCAKIIRDHGGVICIIINDKELERDAAENLLKQYSFNGYDYIFSINNGHILTKKSLNLASKGCYNYHDSLLPLYAGVNSTNWALINKEKKHGISWHKMDEGIDTGSIAIQISVTIDDDDNIDILNTKCFTAAIQGFNDLINKHINSNTPFNHINTTNLLTQKSYYGLTKRPRDFGFINHNTDSGVIKATDYSGIYDNLFMTLKAIENNTIFYITQTKVFHIKGLELIRQESVLQEYINKIKENLDSNIESENAKYLSKINLTDIAKCIKNEDFWVNEFINSNPVSWPFINQKCYNSWHSINCSNSQILNSINFKNNINSEIYVTAFLMLSILKISSISNSISNDSLTGTFALSRSADDLDSNSSSLISCWLPVTVEYNNNYTDEENIYKICELINSRINSFETSSSFLYDIFIRYSKLQKKEPENYIPNISFCINQNSVSVYTKKGNPRHIESLLKILCTDNINYKQHIWDNDIYKLINQPVCDKVKFSGIYTRFEDISLQYKNNIAIEEIETGFIISYYELKIWVENIYNTFIEYDIPTNSRIGITTNRDAGYIAHILAIIKHNCTFVPIDKSQPKDRVDFILKDSGCICIIEEFNPTKITKFETNFIEKSNSIGAYIIYTSGTTGQPKGVKISQKALHNFISSASNLYAIDQNDKILQFSSLTFDACIEEIFCTILNGARLILRDSQMTDIAYLINKTKELSITVWDLPTAFWREIVLSGLYNSIPDNLRLIILGGEALKISDIYTLQNNRDHYNTRSTEEHIDYKKIKHSLINSYGPTETTIVSLAHRVDLDTKIDTNNSLHIPIGKPLAGYNIAIVDNKRSQTLPYQPGELVISGDSLADGYINDSTKTDQSFIEIEINNKKQLYYKTGDLVYYDENGLVYFLSRIDSQIKVRGFRVEPQEVEVKLKEINGIIDCAVIPNDSGNTTELIAFIVINKSENSLKQELTDTIIRLESSNYLPNYMIPSHFIEINSIPLNKSGKTDKKELMRIFYDSQKNRSSIEIANETFSNLENTIRNIWQQVLNYKAISKDSSFFDIGGDSLSAVRMIALVNRTLNLNNSLPLSALINNPTIEKLSIYIEHLQQNNLLDRNKILIPIREVNRFDKGINTHNKIPLFVIHGGGLNILLFRSLSNQLKEGRAVYALQAKGLDGKSDLSTSIEQMATDYIDEILKIDAQGPIYLLGFSLGGFIAYEIAQKLNKKGINVGFVAMVDSVATMAKTDKSILAHFQKIKHLIIRPFYSIMIFISALKKRDNELIKTKIRNYKIKIEYLAIKLKLKKTKETRVTFVEGIPQFQNKNIQLIMHNALKTYKIKDAYFNLELFKADKNTFYIPDKESYGWSKYAQRELNITTMPGEHSKLFANENSQYFAQQLDSILEKYDFKFNTNITR